MHLLVCFVFVQGAPAALRLAPSQLAEMLIRVPLVQRLRCCALVCKAFHAASVLTTRQVVFTERMAEDKYTAGIRWLQAHGQAAGVTSIIFRPNFTVASQSTQQLPFDQLAALQDLELSCPRMPPLPAAVLTSLTYLHCQFDDGSIDELAAFTQLWHLAFLGQRNRTGSQLLVFQQALPHLQALTHLSVSNSLAQDAALQGLQELTCLQDLRIDSSTCTAAVFQALPASLTRLEIASKIVKHQGVWDSQLELPHSSTTHAQRLTALQHFVLSHARAVHPLVLAALTALTQLDVTLCTLAAGRQEAGWHVLSRLTNLQRLDLRHTCTGPEGPQLTAADTAALTAPSQLSYLHVSTYADFQHLLPADRQLHSLKELYAATDLAADLQVIVRLPRCCPNLQVLNLSMADGHEVEELESDEFATLCDALGALPELRTLELDMCMVETSEPATWEALGSLEQLHSLSMFDLERPALHNVLQLTTCWQLTRLMVHVLGSLSSEDAEGEYEVINKVSTWQLVYLAALQPGKLSDSFKKSDHPNTMHQHYAVHNGWMRLAQQLRHPGSTGTGLKSLRCTCVLQPYIQQKGACRLTQSAGASV